MTQDMQREIEALKGMVLAWKSSYLQWAPPDGDLDNDFIVTEFLEEIEIHVYPYTRRLCECAHLTSAEAGEFLNFCYGQARELRDTLKQAASQRV